MRRSATRLIAFPPLLALAACGHSAEVPIARGTGPAPELPAPSKTLIPTVKVADAVGWPAPTPRSRRTRTGCAAASRRPSPTGTT